MVRSKKAKAYTDSEIQEMQDWQENMYNPGHYIGTGRTPYPLKQLAKCPLYKKLMLLYFIVPFVISLFFMDLDWYEVLPMIVVAAAFILIVWDSKRLMKKRKG